MWEDLAPLITDCWWHYDGTKCDSFAARTREPISGGNWWCLDHDQFVTDEAPKSA